MGETATDLGRFDPGDAPLVFIDFRNAAGELADPTTVVLTVRKPDGTKSTPATTHPSLGRYEATVLLDQHGRWDVHWQGTGAVQAAHRAFAQVERSRALG